MSTPVAVHVIDAFEGPRHERLKDLWKHFASTNKDHFTLYVHDNRRNRVDHPEMLNGLWYEYYNLPERYAVFTEFDFLPHPTKFLRPLARLSAAKPAVTAEYCTRDPETHELVAHGLTGAWYMGFLKSACPRNLNFVGRPDTANQICAQVGTEFLPHTDARPRHYGVILPTGTHLFFSRHYNDDPSLRIAGFPLSDIHSGVDRQIDLYADLQRANGTRE